MSEEKDTGISFFEKYLTLWVALCMVVGVVIGKFIPAIPNFLERFEYANVSIPIALFGATSPVALATIVGVLVEVPVMLVLVSFANKTVHWFSNESN